MFSVVKRWKENGGYTVIHMELESISGLFFKKKKLCYGCKPSSALWALISCRGHLSLLRSPMCLEALLPMQRQMKQGTGNWQFKQLALSHYLWKSQRQATLKQSVLKRGETVHSPFEKLFWGGEPNSHPPVSDTEMARWTLIEECSIALWNLRRSQETNCSRQVAAATNPL